MATTTSSLGRNNLDVSRPSDNNDDTNGEAAATDAFCHLVTLFPFVVNDDENNGEAIPSGYESAFATYLAVQHLNARNGRIIAEIAADDMKSCPIQFDIEYLNTHYSAGRALNALMQRIVGQDEEGTGEMQVETMETESDNNDDSSSSSSTLPQQQQQRRQPCAFLGAYRSSISEPTSTFTSFNGYPQISGMSTSSELDDRLSYPLFGRTIPSDAGTAQVVAQHYASLGISHLAIIATNDSFGNAYASELRKALTALPKTDNNNDEHVPTIQLAHIPVEKDGSNIPQAIDILQQLQYRYVFVAHFGGSNMVQNDNLMLQAFEHNLIDNHVWTFSDGIVSSLASKELERDSPLHLAYRGVGSIEASGGLAGNEKYDRFAEDLLQLKEEVLQDDSSSDHPLRSALPYFNDPDYDSILSFLHDDPTFLNPLADGRVPLIYEATVMLGLAACQAVVNITTSSTNASFLHLDGQRFFDTLVNRVSFEGMSGLVTLDPQTGSRVANSTLYRLVNMVEDGDSSTENGMVRLSPVNSMLFKEGKWNTLEPYIYNDGSTIQPVDIPPPDLEPNHITLYIRSISLTLCALAVSLAVFMLCWTWRKRHTRIVRASQPIFLYFVCVGNIILGLTIVPLSFDGGNATLDGLAIACTSTIWLLSIGVGTVFSALFSKAYRINTIMRSSNRCRRIKVSTRDTLIPPFALLFLNVLMLSLMTGLAPIDYEVHTISTDSFGRASETYGSCGYSSDHWEFTIPLFAINFLMICAAAVQSWRSRNLSTEFQESQYIFRALLGFLLVAFIGGPVLIIAQDNTNAYLFVSSALIFVMCLLILLMMFVPKIQYEINRKSMRRGITRISGLDLSSIADTASLRISGATIGMAESAMVARASFESDFDDDSESSVVGERIYSNKTQTELVAEVSTLKKYIRALRNRRGSAAAGPPNNVTNGDNLDSNSARRPIVQFADQAREESYDDEDSGATILIESAPGDATKVNGPKRLSSGVETAVEDVSGHFSETSKMVIDASGPSGSENENVDGKTGVLPEA